MKRDIDICMRGEWLRNLMERFLESNSKDMYLRSLEEMINRDSQ
jgi:hypothetical protein